MSFPDHGGPLLTQFTLAKQATGSVGSVHLTGRIYRREPVWLVFSVCMPKMDPLVLVDEDVHQVIAGIFHVW